MANTVDNVRFNALRNALYHTARRLTYERWDRWFSFLVIALGTSAVSNLTGFVSFSAPAIGAGVAIVGALQLVFGFGRSARDHQGFQRQYYEILAEIEEATEFEQAQVDHWMGRMIRIAGEEPPVMRAIDARAYNDAIDAFEMDKGQRLIVPFWHALLGDFLSRQGFAYQKVSESLGQEQQGGED